MKPIKHRQTTGLAHIGDLVPKVLDKYAGVLPTFYKGITFRARGEARWAVFMDSIGVKWQYEVDGYQFSDGTRYLPDFWLPELNFWVEIKGAEVTEGESMKARQLCEITNARVVVFTGCLVLPTKGDAPSGDVWFPGGGWDCCYQWCECEQCGAVGVEFDGRSDRLPCKECASCWDARHFHNYGNDRARLIEQLRSAAQHVETCDRPPGCRRSGANGDKGYAADTPRLLAAYTAALSERFGT